MNIEQMLRDAIERKTAKILKEEYGIELRTPIPPDEQDNQDDQTEQDNQDEQDECPVYQVTLLEAGANREDLIKFIANVRMIEPSYAEALVDHIPSVIVRDFTKKAAMIIVDELAKLNASAMLERTVFINSIHKINLNQSWNRRSMNSPKRQCVSMV